MDAWQSAWVEVLPDFKNFTRKANTEMTSVLSTAGTAGGVAASKGMNGGILAGIPKLAGPLLAAFAALGIGNLIGQAVGSGIRYGLDAVDLASDLRESVNAVQVSFGSAIAADLKVLSEAAPDTLRVTRKTFNEFATRFGSFAKTIVGDGGDIAGLIDELTTRGADFASVYNLDVGDALGKFQSGLAGETEPLRQFGVDLSDNAITAYAYANGIAEVGEQLTEAEKVQARYGALLAQTAGFQGDAARTAGDYASQARGFAVALEEAQTSFGEAFLPAATDILQWANTDLLPILEGALDKAGPKLEQSIRDVMPEVKALVETAADGLPGAIEVGVGLAGAAANSFELDFGRGNGGVFDPAVWEGIGQFLSDNAVNWEEWRSTIDISYLEVTDAGARWVSAHQRYLDMLQEENRLASDELKSYWKTTLEQMRADTEILAAGGALLGAQFAQGFADGIETEVEKVALAAERMALAARDKVVGTMEIRSPSKVMHELGGFVAAGFAGGITDGTPAVSTAIGDMVSLPAAQMMTRPEVAASVAGTAVGQLPPIHLEVDRQVFAIIEQGMDGRARLILNGTEWPGA